MYKQLLGWASLLFSAVLSAPLFADSAPAVGINMLAEPAHPQHFERQFRGTVTRVPLSPNVAYPDDAYDIFNQDYGQSFTQRFVARQRNAACNAGAFVSSGDALLNQIKTQGFECVGELFNTASDTIKTGTFTQANILTVTAEAKRLATAYQALTPATT